MSNLFVLKVKKAMASTEGRPMNGNVQTDDLLGGYDWNKIGSGYNAKKRKAVTAVEFTDYDILWSVCEKFV